jgi:hypothetical protein
VRVNDGDYGPVNQYKPCHHDDSVPACRSCRLWDTDPEYRARWTKLLSHPVERRPADQNITIRAYQSPAAPRPTAGPGTELKDLLVSYGIITGPTCGCKVMANQMNAWGVEGCPAHMDEIVNHLKAQAKAAGWKTTVVAGLKAIARGHFYDPLNPFPGLVKEAIRRAAEKEGK